MTSHTDADLIRQLIAHYLAAYAAHDAEGCAAVYAEDALVLSPWGQPARGRPAIAAEHVAWFAAGETNKVMTVEHVETAGHLGICLARFEADIAAEGGGLEKIYGASLNSLRRQPGGGWEIRHTSLNQLQDGKTGFAA